MKWKLGGPYFMASDDGRYLIARANTRSTATYSAFRSRGDTVAESLVHAERGIPADDDAARLAALDRCKAACEADARV